MMPRAADPSNADEQARVARWRDENAARGRPEASAVDVALAGAATAYVQAADENRSLHAPIAEALMTAAVNLLVAKGFDRRESIKKLRDRLRRRDLWQVCETAGIGDRLCEGTVPRARS